MFSRFITLSIIVSLAIATSSCTENGPPQQSEHEKLPQQPAQTSNATAQSNATASAQPRPGGTNTAAPADSGMPIPPKDARYTLSCTTFAGPDHVRQANQLKAQLLKGTKLRDWYVVHTDNESTLFYGFYRAFDDPNDKKETARAQTDRKQINNLTTTAGDQPFKLALFVELAAPDPAAPPEWNLANLKTSKKDDIHYFSLEIAAYKDSPQRKQLAVDSVREARAQGVPAYYYHGESISSVCIGVWPKSAVKEQDSDSAESSDPTQTLMVLPKALPPNAPSDVRIDGERVKILQPVFEPQDPTLIEAMKRYPEHSINGQVIIHKATNPRTGVEKEIPDPSFLVQIPFNEATLASGASGTRDTVVAPPPPMPARAPSTPGAGKLKSIGQ